MWHDCGLNVINNRKQSYYKGLAVKSGFKRDFEIFPIILSLDFCKIILIALLILPYNLFAASTWEGTVSSEWGNPANWSGIAPDSNTVELDIIIPTSPTGGIFPILSVGTYSINQLRIMKGAIILQNGGTLIINGDLVINSGSPSGTFNQTDGILQIKKAWTNRGIFNSTGGTVRFSPVANGVFNVGNNQFYHIIIDDGVNPNFDKKGGSNILIAGDFTNNNPNLNVSTKATFTVNGNGDQNIYSASSTGNSTFGNLVIDNPSGTVFLQSDIEVAGTFEDLTGSLDKNGYNFRVGGVSLPVELTLFSALVEEDAVFLHWITQTEVNNYGFEIERNNSSEEIENWENIGFVEGHGNSNSPKDYKFVDKHVVSGIYAYRLKQIDIDGRYEYSEAVKIDVGSLLEFNLSKNYPNPFNPTTIIVYYIPRLSFVTLKVFDVLGNEIGILVNEKKAIGTYEITWYAGSLPSGVYFYRLQAGDFIDTKRMVLLK